MKVPEYSEAANDKAYCDYLSDHSREMAIIAGVWVIYEAIEEEESEDE